MKRVYMNLFLVLIVSILLSGCGSDNKKTTSTTTTSSTITTTESTTTKSTTIKSTKKKTTSWGKDIYLSSKDKKKHKYSYTYKDYDTCFKRCDDHYEEVNKVRPYVTCNCEKITDQKGNVLYGVYYNEFPDDESKFYY